MHGRLKVRTSAEEAARKKKEQQQKMQIYRSAMNRIFQKRDNNELDDEMIQLTGEVLRKNPDIFTLWNIRRDCIVLLRECDNEKFLDMCDKDLGFTEYCLQVNPKSYCAWHHRCWILETTPEPNWKREIDLCTKYLKMDERNFHCWDYRRYIVIKDNIPADKELDFCTKKIQNNFSNYSSWDYRSKLLPILYPHPDDSTRPINEEILRNELEMVLTAAFTDPNDSSAWFYQRWLLGYSQPVLDVIAFKLSITQAIICFSLPINLNSDQYTLSLDGSKLENKNWKSINNIKFDKCWYLEESFEFNNNSGCVFDIEFVDGGGGGGGDGSVKKSMLTITKYHNHLFGIKMPKFGYEFGKTIVDELKEQLNSCNQLLEYEPNSKWTLLTAALLMRAIDRNESHTKTLDYLNKLKLADPLRTGYYTDLANKWTMELELDKWIKLNSFYVPLNLADLDLVSLFYEEYLCVADEIDLRNNNLSNRNFNKLNMLRKCKVNVLLK